MKLRFVALALGITGAMWTACSLGEGITPTCDPTKAPPDPAACQQAPACDNGRGVVVPTDECCLDAATKRFRICLGTNETFDPAPCMAMPPPGQCTCPGGQVAERDCAVADACATWSLCKAGVLNGAGGGGGAATGGAGGAGGAGGGAGGATGGAAGGS